MYSRTSGCPFVTTAKLVLHEHQIPYREVFIDQDPAARERVLDWTGFLSVPTLIVAPLGEDLPLEIPPPLPKGASPRGIDRGAMITEPNTKQFSEWLRKHGFMD
jgi:glutaredoxin